ncbi:4-hydroxy-tetrahydrodipicolinate reductase [Algoriphagus namhaensis]|uniref:4-hydroxy-tetrahydrodipicolinate reductase n=1 Tax=Algoriphagus namhaensis TaxID=915353 RepID=A0ABV8APF1_9BACT
MNILLLGYGKMGKLIGELGEQRGHQIAAKISIDNTQDLDSLDPKSIDVAIDFSQPESAISNIKWGLERGIPVISGTTGWLDRWDEIVTSVEENDGTFFYASNFSIGVNVLFKVNQYLAKLMNEVSDYSVTVEEIHHTAKLDAPSGTAITIAEGIIENMGNLDSWILKGDTPALENQLPIISKRIDPAPGTHIISYQSKVDDLVLSHTAHSREGFVKGAILVAEWITDKKGVLSMNDFLSF